ncbi:MAG TPA: RNA-binding cell elongation regulator Jag/EloR [Acidimicrobiia bacterium]|nr:RNA-binding cell elongation regulator Jag/EloR [Acidimicrobiia bacterium]
MVEWVEVRGKSVDVAVGAAMNELGVSDRSQVDVEVVQEPEKGFLGLGGRDAIVRVKPKVQRGRTRDRRPRSGGGRPSGGRPSGARPSGARGEGGRGGRNDSGSRSGGPRGDSARPQSRTGGQARSAQSRSRVAEPSNRPERLPADINPAEQAPVVEQFLRGLIDSFGLEGSVRVEIDDDVIIATVEGEQTEALVGVRGSVMDAVHEITKTTLHRQFKDTARVRLDIAGYAERRRQALSIYAGQLIDQVKSEGGEIMLEPMSAADRKVIHDSVAAVEGVRSYSEGEPPRRYVVISQIEDGGEDEGEDEGN